MTPKKVLRETKLDYDHTLIRRLGSLQRLDMKTHE